MVTCFFKNIGKTNVLAIDSSRDLAVNPLQVECPEHALSPIRPTLQVYHEHLRTFITNRHTQRNEEVSVCNGYLMEFSCSSEIHTPYLIKAHLIGLSGRRAEIPGGLDRGISNYVRTETDS